MAALENVRHETYAQEIAKGLSQRKAYRIAFPKSIKWKDETVDSKASVLAKQEKVLARINELKELASNKAIKTATERKIWLSRVMDDENEDTNTKLKACDQLNKMEGEYTTKIEGELKVKKLEDLL
jgi:hypothetical protein